MAGPDPLPQCVAPAAGPGRPGSARRGGRIEPVSLASWLNALYPLGCVRPWTWRRRLGEYWLDRLWFAHVGCIVAARDSDLLRKAILGL